MDRASQNKVTVFIPTHNRPKYLRRALDYLQGSGLDILVCDSSETRQSLANPDGLIRYLHFPNIGYVEKLHRALQEVRTPFMVFMADDDFAIPEAVLKSVAFLEAHPDFVSCMGFSFRFAVIEEEIVFWAKGCRFERLGETPSERFFQGGNTPYYSVLRTDILQKTFGLIANSQLNQKRLPTSRERTFYYYVDLALTTLLAAGGKFKRLDIPFGARENSLNREPATRMHGDFYDGDVAAFHQDLIEGAGRLMGDADGACEDALRRCLALQFCQRLVWAESQTSEAESQSLEEASPATNHSLLGRWLPASLKKRLQSYRLRQSFRRISRNSGCDWTMCFLATDKMQRIRTFILSHEVD
ncbi:MAG: TIGR00180 family glycosyltransferase [Magnetococcales bacterium]|nr:TIGR00180 family glycosyltransferase [Magnetococcales bacterium]